MALRDFFVDGARKRVGDAVEVIERDIEVEVVVTVRKRSGHYRRTDLYTGAMLAYAMLLFMLFYPQPFDTEWMPVDVVVAFLFGVAFSLEVSAFRRAMTPKSLLDEAVRLAAHSAFYTLGVSRTTGRTGVLVFVSMFERRVLVVPDVGVNPEALGPEWASAALALSSSLRDGPDFELFLSALGGLKAPLTKGLPVIGTGGHKNQLANEPVLS